VNKKLLSKLFGFTELYHFALLPRLSLMLNTSRIFARHALLITSFSLDTRNC